MPFHTLAELVERLRTLGANRILCKRLAENDNSKQQIYLGGSFDALQLLPYRNVRTERGTKRDTFKAELDFSWVDAEGRIAKALGAQLILYPRYPEVRLSGFLRDCPLAPRDSMKPVPKGKRVGAGPDGRVLFLATTPSNTIFAYLARPGDAVAREVEALHGQRKLLEAGLFLELPIYDAGSSRQALLQKLRAIHAAGWHPSRRLSSSGVALPYMAQNGGGYTLEALFGIIPNGVSAPDFLGWELKAFSSGRVTLMTPEPDTGYYGENGVEAFVRRYGRKIENDVLYFTGTHRANERCSGSGHTLMLRGFNLETRKIVDVDGGIELVDSANFVTAGWSFKGLIEHWGRKHASAAYIRYEKQDGTPPNYRYLSPVLLGEGTDFTKYLSALAAGHVVYDPGSKIMAASSRPRTKARSQFRIKIAELPSLYHRFDRVAL